MMHSLYRYYSEADTLLYAGISHHPFKREAQHEASDKDMSLVRVIEIEWFPSMEEAAIAERAAISREKPQWNKACQRRPRKAKITAKSAIKAERRKQKKLVALVPEKVTNTPPKITPRRYHNMGPHLPPLQGPPKPWKHYGVNIHDGDIEGVKIDYSVKGGDEAIKRAFKIARRGDVIHMKAGVKPIFYEAPNGSVEHAPYVQFH